MEPQKGYCGIYYCGGGTLFFVLILRSLAIGFASFTRYVECFLLERPLVLRIVSSFASLFTQPRFSFSSNTMSTFNAELKLRMFERIHIVALNRGSKSGSLKKDVTNIAWECKTYCK